MAWEARKRGGSYYTRSTWRDGRVLREYVGTGPTAEVTAAEDAMRREAREQEALDRRTERERFDELDAPGETLDALATALSRAALVLAGYRQHDRGQWRRRRGNG
jgi:hypothetical protein